MSSPRPSSSTSRDPAVPVENILDLRRSSLSPRPPRRSETLEAFWRRPPRPKRSPRSWSAWARARLTASGRPTRPFRLNPFPLIAVGLVVVFAVGLAVAQLVGLRSQVLEIAQAGYRSLSVAAARAAARDLTAAQAAFADAAQQFQAAEQAFGRLNPALESVIVNVPIAGSKLKSAQHLVAAARAAAQAGERFSSLAIPLSDNGEGFSEAASLVGNLERDRVNLRQIVADLATAAHELSRVRSNDLPAPYAATIGAVQKALPGLRATLAGFESGTLVLADLLGVDQPVEYLFVFQNANELRPTGGFAGSFALIRIDHGVFRILDAPNRGSLGVDDYLPETTRPPLPLQVITPSWYFRDANWYPDWPTSAQQLVRFYQQARGFAPRGVVGLTHRLIERLLGVTGPIELPAYGVTIDQENFARVAQEQIELKYDLRVNDPKKFIVDLVPILAERLSQLDLSQYPALLATALESAATGDLQLWSAEPAVQENIITLGWSGAMRSPDGDFLELVDTNVGGGKTDGVIDQQINHRVDVDRDGRLLATVGVTRTHRGTFGNPFTGYRNRTYHRFYVPRGSRLLGADGFTTLPASIFLSLPAGSKPDPLLTSTEGRVVVDEQSGTRINDEFGLTVFGNWTELDPGETKTFTLTYELPLTLSTGFDRYDVTIGRQAGAQPRQYDFNVSLADGTVVWSSVTQEKLNAKRYSYSASLEYSRSLSLILKR